MELEVKAVGSQTSPHKKSLEISDVSIHICSWLQCQFSSRSLYNY